MSSSESRPTIESCIRQRAFFWHERLSKKDLKVNSSYDDTDWKRYRDFWKQKVAGNHQSAFQRRLEIDQISEEQLPELLNSNWESDIENLNWAIPDKLVSYIKSHYSDWDWSEPDEKPFESLINPIAEFWFNRYAEIFSDAGVSLSLRGEDALRDQLQTSVSKVMVHLLYQMFDQKRQDEYGMMARLQPKKLSDEHTIYRSFVEEHLENGLYEFFSRYPVLARFLGERIGRSIAECRKMLNRMETDQQQIEAALGVEVDVKAIDSLELFMSDPHADQQMVTRFRFEDGEELIYKPRSSRQEATWYRFAEAVNDLQKEGRLEQNLKMPKIITQNNYSWVEVIDHAYPEAPAEREKYYYRMGMLQALAGYLGATDFHNENLIPSGAYPVIVDHEVFTTSAVLVNHLSEEQLNTFNHLHHISGMLTSGLMPMIRDNQKGSIDGSAYSMAAIATTDTMRDRWTFTGTDGMYVNEHAEEQEGTQPRFNPYEFSDAARRGFEDLRKACSFKQIEAFIPEDLEYRMVIRNTNIYARFLKSAFKPKYLKDGLLFSLFADQLMRTALFNSSNIDEAVFKDELRQFLNFDIPYFSGRLNEYTVYGRNVEQPLSDHLPINPLKRIREMNVTEGSEKKTEIISKAISLTSSILSRNHSRENINLIEQRETLSEVCSEDEKKSFVHSLMHHLWQQTSIVGDTMLIMNLDGSGNSPRSILSPMSLALYRGLSGVAIFAEGVQTHLAGPESQWWTEAFHKELEKVIEHPQLFIDPQRLDLFSGIAGNISAFVQCARISGKDLYQDAAESLAKAVDFSKARATTHLDIGSGIPGYMAALLQLADLTGKPGYTERALKLCHQLTEHIVNDPVPHLKTMDGKALAGYSHGQSGVASVLIQLHKQTGEKKPLEIAQSLIEYENTLWSEEAENWMDLRLDDYKENDRHMCSWCHGGTGIGLNRLQLLEVCDEDWVRADLNRAITATLNQKWEGKDGMCCGLTGRALFLRKAGYVLQRNKLIQTSEELTASIIQNYNRLGFLLLNPGLSDLFMQPGFFQGYAGVGYQVLISLDDVDLPDMLSFE